MQAINRLNIDVNASYTSHVTWSPLVSQYQLWQQNNFKCADCNHQISFICSSNPFHWNVNLKLLEHTHKSRICIFTFCLFGHEDNGFFVFQFFVCLNAQLHLTLLILYTFGCVAYQSIKIRGIWKEVIN